MSKIVILGQFIHIHYFVNILATLLHSTFLAGICVRLQTKIKKMNFIIFLTYLYQPVIKHFFKKLQ